MSLTSKIDNIIAKVNLKATLASPSLTGIPVAPTASLSTNTTQLATTAFVNAEIANDAPTKTGSGASGTWSIATTGNSGTSTKLATARTISLSGDVTGTVSFDGSANSNIVATIAANSVALGTDTTGNYVAGNTSGTGITVSGTAGEGWSPIISLSNTGTAGTYRSVTTNAQGQITSGTNPTTISGYAITDAYTKTEVDTKVANLVNSAPALLDTLDELAAALGDDPNFASTVATNIGTRVVANTVITAGTNTKITYDTKGLVTDGTILSATDIPVLDTSKLTTGVLPVLRGGTGTTTNTGSGNVVLSISPVLTTPNIGIAVGTSFNSITALSSTTPNMDGIASIGTSTTVARADHIHASDTSKANLASPTFTGTVTAPTFSGVLSGNASTATTLQTARTINGVSFNGSANITVVDSTKAPLVSPALTGTPTAPTAGTGTNTTQIATAAFVFNNIPVYAETPSYGLEWNETADTYTRVGDSDYTRIQRTFRRCVINADAEVVYYLHPNNSLLKEDGTLADLSGADGNVMVEVPLTYVKYTYSTGTVKHKWEIQNKEEVGFAPHECFVIAGEVKRYRYFPAYNGTVQDNKLMSVSGTYATTNKSRTQFRPLAKANGATFCQQDWLLTEFISLMALIEFGTMNIQTALGQGRSALTGGTFVGGSLIGINGLSNSLGNQSGNYTYAGSADAVEADLSFMSYRGIENFYGNVWKWLDGINVSERIPFVSQNPNEFADDKYSGSYVSTGVTLAVSSGSYGRTLGNSSKGFFVTSVSGGTSSVGTTDGLLTATGSMAVLFGGRATDGLVNGAFYTSSSSNSSFVNIAVGACPTAWSKD